MSLMWHSFFVISGIFGNVDMSQCDQMARIFFQVFAIYNYLWKFAK